MRVAFHELGQGAHGLVATTIFFVATAFVILGKMTVDQWIDMTKWIAGLFFGTHAAITAVQARRSSAQLGNLVAPVTPTGTPP